MLHRPPRPGKNIALTPILQPEPDLPEFSPLPEAPSFLSDLFANDVTEADDLRSQVNRIIQHSSLSLTSKSGIIGSYSKY